MAVASFNRLSPSTSTVRRLGAPNCRKIAITATGSVALRIDPSSRAAGSGIGVTSATMAPIRAVEINSPGTARVSTGPIFSRSSRPSSANADSKISVGRNTNRMTDGEISNARYCCSATGNTPSLAFKAMPVTTSNTVNGSPVRLLTTSATAATSNSSITDPTSCSTCSDSINVTWSIQVNNTSDHHSV